MKFQTQWEKENFTGERNFPPSQTIPDQTLTIPEILKRNAQGLPITGNIPSYDENLDENNPNPINYATLDLTELAAMRDELTAKMQAARKQHYDKQKKDADDKLKALIKAEAEKLAKEVPEALGRSQQKSNPEPKVQSGNP